MKRRDCLKAAIAAIAAMTMPRSEALAINPDWPWPDRSWSEDYGDVIGYANSEWSWSAKRKLKTRHWLVHGQHHQSGIQWMLLISEKHLEKRGITINQYLKERPAFYADYVTRVQES